MCLVTKSYQGRGSTRNEPLVYISGLVYHLWFHHAHEYSISRNTITKHYNGFHYSISSKGLLQPVAILSQQSTDKEGIAYATNNRSSSRGYLLDAYSFDLAQLHNAHRCLANPGACKSYRPQKL